MGDAFLYLPRSCMNLSVHVHYKSDSPEYRQDSHQVHGNSDEHQSRQRRRLCHYQQEVMPI